MPDSLPPEVLQEIKNTADVIKARFTPPEFIPGCQVVDVTDIDLYATNNGWIEAVCGQHNQQRVRYKGFPSNVGTASYVDVLYFQNRRLFECYGSGGTIAPPGADGWPFDALKVISPTNASAEATTVQGAFDTGDALDIFLVDPGTYVETITANKLISIVGGEAARCIIRGTTSDTPVINATAAALFKELTVTNEAGGTTAACVNVSTSLISPQFYNLRVSKSLGGGTTGVGFDISAGTGIWIENCRISISNGTNRYGLRVTGTATFTVTVVGGSISAATADVLVNNSNATVRLWGPVLTGGGLSITAGTVTGWWYDSSGGLHIIGGGWPYNDVHNVGGNARLATVEAALNDAAVGAGDVVELGQDSTEDAVALDKTVTVQGKSREFVLTVDNSANGLNISANGARVERLNVVNTTTAATTYGVYCNATGIVLERVSALVAAGGTTRYGIAVPSSMDATLRDCTAQGTGGGGTNAGLVVDGTAVVYDGELSGDYSLLVGAAGNVTLKDVTLVGNIYSAGGPIRGTARDAKGRDCGVIVTNTSGGAVVAGDVGYLDEAGEFKTTTTAGLIVNWHVVTVGGLDNSPVFVRRAGNATINYTGSDPAAGDYLTTSTSAGDALATSTMQPGVFAVCLAAGSGGVVEALLLCNTVTVDLSPSELVCRPGVPTDDSDFVATIASLPGGAVLTYNAPSSGDENVIVPFSANTLAKLVLHNTTRGTSALISACDTGTNTITLTANVPAGWQVNDTITARSQANTVVVGTAYYMDFEFTSAEIPALTRSINFDMLFLDGVGAGERLILHTFEAFAGSKRRILETQAASRSNTRMAPVPIFDKRFTLQYSSSGAGAALYNISAFQANVAAP